MSPTEDCLTDIIRLQLKKPKNWNWNLTTSKSLPHLSLPTIQLFNSKGEILVQTNDLPSRTKRQSWHSSDLQRCESDNFGRAMSYNSSKKRLHEHNQKRNRLQRCRSESVAISNPPIKYDVNFIKSDKTNLKNGSSCNHRQRSFTCSSINDPKNRDSGIKTPRKCSSKISSKDTLKEISPDVEQSNILGNVNGLKMRHANSEILSELNKIKLKYIERETGGKLTKKETGEMNEKPKFAKTKAYENEFYLRKSKSELGSGKARSKLHLSPSSTQCNSEELRKKSYRRRTTSDDLFKRRLKYSEESLRRAEQDGYRNFIENEFDRIKQIRCKSKEINNNNDILASADDQFKEDEDSVDNNMQEKDENNNGKKINRKKKKMLPAMCTAETVLCDNKPSHYQITELKERRYKLRESRAGILLISDDSFSYNHRRRCHGEELSEDNSVEISKSRLFNEKPTAAKTSMEAGSTPNAKSNILNETDGTYGRRIMERVKNPNENSSGKDIFRSLSYCSGKSNSVSKPTYRSNSGTNLNNKSSTFEKSTRLQKKCGLSNENIRLAQQKNGSKLDDLFYYEDIISPRKNIDINARKDFPIGGDNQKREKRFSNSHQNSLDNNKYDNNKFPDIQNSRQNSLNSETCEIKSLSSCQSSFDSEKREIESLMNSRQASLNSEQSYFVQEPLTTPGSEVCEFVADSDKDHNCRSEMSRRQSLRRRMRKKLRKMDRGHSAASSDDDSKINGHIIQSAKSGRGKVTNCDLLQLVRRLSSPKLAAQEDNEATADHKPQRVELEASRKRAEKQIQIESIRDQERDVEDDERHVKDMGSNVSRHSSKGLSGRRSQSSGSICNGKGGRQTGDGKGSGGSLPSFLDDEESIYNNNHCDEESDAISENRVPLLGDGAPLHWKFSENQTTLSCHDQGYGSERSPEEEYPPPMPDHNLEQCHHHLEPHTCYPFITPESTFTVKLTKGSRGLGLSVTGGVDSIGSWPGLVRIKRLFPHQPASACGLLNVGDLLLEANGVTLTGLSNYEALEVLRTASNQVELRVCRPPPDVLNCVSPISEVPPPPPTRREPPSTLNLPPACYGNTPEDDYYHGEFEMTLTKIQGSLGFTLRKEDDSALGHYVRALVREPALTDGRIKAGDKIIAVNDVEISSMSHEQAVQFLRKSGDTVKLRLYRDAAQTPVSALSPTETTPRASFNKKANLRQEAVDMLNDIAVRKLIPGTQEQSRGSFSPNVSPRKLTRKVNHSSEAHAQGDGQYGTMHEEQFHEALLQPCPHPFSEEDYNSLFSIEDDTDRPSRPSSLDLYNPNQTPVVARKPKFNFSLAHNAYELNNLDAEVLDAPNLTYNLGNEDPDPQNDNFSREPASMPHLPLDDAAFSHKIPVYQSAHLPSCSSSSMEAGTSHQAHGREGLSHHHQHVAYHPTRHSSDSSYHPNDIPPRQFRERVLSDCSYHQNHQQASFSRTRAAEFQSSQQNTHHQVSIRNKESISSNQSRVPMVESNVGADTRIDRQFPEGSGTMKRKSALKKSTEPKTEGKIAPKKEPEILAIELNRGWNSRLGFSLQGAAGVTYVSAVHADSVAARDGRIKPGDIILKVNDESVEQMSTNEIIDLLRIIRGPVCIVVKRNSQNKIECSN